MPECRGKSLSGIISMVKEGGRPHSFLKTLLRVSVHAAFSSHKHLKALNICLVSPERLLQMAQVFFFSGVL